MLRFIFIVVNIGFVVVPCRAQLGQQIQKPVKNDVCAAFCDDSYKLQANTTEACKQGCNLFSILQLTSETPEPDEKTIGRECVKSCLEGYSADEKSQQACSAGCRNQTVKVGSVEIQLDGSSPFINKISDITDRIFSPAMSMLQYINSRMSDMMSPLKDRVFSSWYPESVGDDSEEDQIKSDSEREIDKADTVVSTASSPTVGNADENGDAIVVVHVIPPRTIESQDFVLNENSAEVESKQEDSTLIKDSPMIAFEPSPPVVRISPLEDEDDWLACVGRRIRHLSMITRWMLCLAMILSVAGMIWICMAILRTKPRRHLMYISQKSCSKGGVDNVYYTIPPYSSAATAADVKSSLESPPAYEAVVSDAEKKNPITA